MQCSKCKFWGDGDGTGNPYDAGHMNYCNHRQISGIQHPAFGACGDLTTMVYVTYRNTKTGNWANAEEQKLETRWNFGCILFESFK